MTHEIPTSPGALSRGIVWLWQLAAISGGKYPSPLAQDTGDGGLMYEWWNHDLKRKITVYCYEHEITYLRVWGPNPDTDMDDGVAEPIKQFEPVWAWLWGEEERELRVRGGRR